ncbi:phosphotransferase family protein [Streptacidiphilus sp. PB12-B1b]|uniref:phosphotransferase family protein n=1 Tax=Streptacidiphilus sp. PB12-B1b TaxID=2705012 RepID=UPI0015FA27D2|nr:phosphotransferase family protein [Streptacidiphilus sp. PB12-B1b]QMU76117.1 phosphotransferase family protein [Streptacidiphilus sp. PB12-B1b]
MSAPGAPRPRTTTRDPAELERRLAAWIADRQPGATVRGLSVPPSNGMSSETVLFDLVRPDGTAQDCVLRLAADPDAYAVFPHYDMERQYRVMQLVAARTKAPVPRLLWLETDPGPLGAAGFVMERVEGRVPPDVMPYTYGGNWLFTATDAERDRLEQATLEVLAALHTLPADGLAAFLAPAATDGLAGATPLRRHVEQQRGYYAWVVRGRPRSPLIERAFARLEELWPQDEGPSVLSWGDARIGNIVYQGFTPVAVLDWEMASLGPRELDLAWLVFLHRFFQDLTEASGLPGLPGFLEPGRVAERYAALTGHTPRDLEFHTLYAALRHAVVMLRIAYRRLHFGEAALPDEPTGADVDRLILHRPALEAMLDRRGR